MRTNEELISYLRAMGFADEHISAAMKKYPREIFLPKYQKENAYYDIPLLIGENQTCSAPSMIAMMLSVADIKEGHKVLEIGTGSGWQTALLSYLAGRSGTIVSMDLVQKFSAEAEARFAALDIKNTIFINADGKKGYSKKAPYDRIIVSAAADKMHDEWVKQLKEGGIIILPMGPLFSQFLYKGVKTGNKVKLERLMAVAFVNLM